MRTISIVLFSLLLTHYAIGQNDQEALKILDKFSESALKAPSVSMKFILITTNLTDNKNDTLKGSVIISKDKYKLDLPDNTCLLYTSPSPRDRTRSRMPSYA